MHKLRHCIARSRPAGTSLVSQLVGIDVRALAVVRVGIGVLILCDLAVRATDLTVFYSDDGVLPRTLLVGRSSPWVISLYVLSGAPAFVALLFAIAAVAAMCLLVGYRTPVAAVVSWLLLVSVQNRNPLVNQNGDLLLHLVLFWALFLPLGARYSIDRRQGRAGPAPTRVVSFASFALLAQVVMMYVFAGMLKSGPDWTRNGTAVYYALQYRLLATPRAHFLLQDPGLLKSVTGFVPWFERLGPLLFFIPVVGAPVRIAAVFLFMSFHLGMSTFLTLGPFMWVPEVALIAFLPSSFWDWLERTLRRGPFNAASIRAGQLAARRAFLLPATVLLAVPGALASGGCVGVDRADALITGEATASANAAQQTRPAASGEGLEVNRQARALSVALRNGARSVLPLVLIAYVFLLNLRTVTHNNYLVLPGLQWLGDSLALNQEWNMFAPRPPHASGWFVIPARLRDGHTLDLWRGPKRVSWKEPASIEALYPNERWRKYAENLAKSPQLEIDYSRYLCRSWNTSHYGGTALDRFKIYYMQTLTPPSAGDRVSTHRLLQVTWFCFGKPAASSQGTFRFHSQSSSKTSSATEDIDVWVPSRGTPHILHSVQSVTD